MMRTALIIVAVMIGSPVVASAQTNRHHPHSLRCQQAQWNLVIAGKRLSAAISEGGDVVQAQLNQERAQAAVRHYC